MSAGHRVQTPVWFELGGGQGEGRLGGSAFQLDMFGLAQFLSAAVTPELLENVLVTPGS